MKGPLVSVQHVLLHVCGDDGYAIDHQPHGSNVTYEAYVVLTVQLFAVLMTIGSCIAPQSDHVNFLTFRR